MRTTIDAADLLRGISEAMSQLSSSMESASHAFRLFGLAATQLRRDRVCARMMVRELRRRLGWRRFFSAAWYQAVYDLHQLTRGEA